MTNNIFVALVASALIASTAIASGSSKADADFQKSYDEGVISGLYGQAGSYDSDDKRLGAIKVKIATETEKYIKAGSTKALCEQAYFYEGADSSSVWHRDSAKAKKLRAEIKKRKISCPSY